MNRPSKNRIRYLLLVLLLASCLPSYTQDFRFENFNELNGLPSSESYQIFQDSRGFLWVATDNGVVRFDGDQFDSFSTAQGLTDNTVFGFHEDYQGRIWFRTFSGGMCYFKNDSIYPYQHNKLLKEHVGSSLINNFYVDRLNSVWISTSMYPSISKIDSAGKLLSMENKTMEYLALHTVDSGFVLGASGAPDKVRAVKINGTLYPLSLDETEGQATVVIRRFKWKGKLHFIFNKNIFRWDGSTVSKVLVSDKTILSANVDRDGRLWVGYFLGGFDRFSSISSGMYIRDNYQIEELHNLSPTSFLKDAEGGMWITTLERGLFYFPDLRIRNQLRSATYKISYVTEKSNKIFAATEEGEVIEMNPRGEPRFIKKFQPPIGNLVAERLDKIWVTDTEGNHIIDQYGAEFPTDKSLPFMRGIHQISSGYFGFNTTSLFRISKQGVLEQRVDFRQRANTIATAGNKVILGSLYGLDVFNAADLEAPSQRLTDTRIASVLVVNDSVCLVGTVGQGLLVANIGKSQLAPLKLDKGVNVYSMVRQGDRIWVGTEAGIALLSVHNLTSGFIQLNKFSGLVSDKINFLALQRNRLWAFSDDGVAIIPLEIFDQLPVAPRVYIKKILVNNRPYRVAKLNLEHDQNNIVIELGIISFKNKPNFFRYRMSNEEEWSTIFGSNIVFSDLRPGSYKIDIEVSRDGTVWTQGVLAEIEIDKPWWSTWLFRILVVVSVMLVAFLIYRARVNVIKNHQNYLELINLHQQKLIDSEIQTQERERKRIAKDLHDGIGTSLSSIKLLLSDALSADSEARTVRAQEINENLTEVIGDIRRIVYDLNPPALERYGLQVGLKNLADKVNGHSNISVILDYYGTREVAPSVAITIYRVIQELINNTLKHAKATEIRIHVNQFEDDMNIMYEDNGIGMVGSRFTGLGLHNIESRIRSLKGRMSWESNHKGTFYNFDIPFH